MWIKSSDTDLTDRRQLEAGPLGRDLYHRAQLFMAGNLTNGHISRQALRALDAYSGITEDGAAVTLTGLADRLVKLELWRNDGDSYYDIRYAGLNPADLIEKKQAAGRASAATRAAKYGTSNPRANAPSEQGEHTGEQAPEHTANPVNRVNIIVNRPRPRSSQDSVSKSPDQLNGFDNSRGQDGDAEVLDHAVQVDQVDVAGRDDDPAVQLPATVEEPTAPHQDVHVLAAPELSMRQRFLRRRVRTHNDGTGAVLTVYGNEIVVKLDSDGDQRRYYAADLEVIRDVEKFAEFDLVETERGPGEVVNVLPGDRYMVFLSDGSSVVFPASALKPLVVAF